MKKKINNVFLILATIVFLGILVFLLYPRVLGKALIITGNAGSYDYSQRYENVYLNYFNTQNLSIMKLTTVCNFILTKDKVIINEKSDSGVFEYKSEGDWVVPFNDKTWSYKTPHCTFRFFNGLGEKYAG